MESDWRWNVADLGWSRSPFRLIARLLEPIGIFPYVGQFVPGQAEWTIFRNTFTGAGAQGIQTFGTMLYEDVIANTYPD